MAVPGDAARQDEAARLDALVQLNMLDTPPEPEFDEIVRLAAAICDTAIATVTLVDKNRVWFKSRIGLSLRETPRAISLCAQAILHPEPLIIPDTLADTRFSHNPMVTGSPFLRFYAGFPLITRSGQAVGTLALMDLVPRELNETQQLALKVLAQQVMRQLESARTIVNLGQAVLQRDAAQADLQKAHEQLEMRVRQRTVELEEAHAAYLRANELYRMMWETTTDAVLIADTDGKILYANPSSLTVLGYAPEQLVGKNLAMIQPERTDVALLHGIQRYLAPGIRTLACRSSEFPCLKADGSEVTMEVAYAEISEQGQRHLIGFFRDISERKRNQSEQRELANRVEEALARLAEAQAVAKIGSWDADLRNWKLTWSDETFRIFEVEKENFVPSYQGFLALVQPEDRAAVDAKFIASIGEHSELPHEFEHRRVTASGRTKLVQERWRIFYDELGKPIRAVGTAQDITERRAEQNRILRLSRMHEVLSGVNSLIVRATDRQELFEGCCRIAAKHGQFGAAWIDVYDSALRQVHPVARDGIDAGDVVPGPRSADPDAGEGLGLAARAIVEGKAMLSNEFSSEPGISAEWTRAGERGYHSGIALPLTENGEIVGTLSLLAKDANFFDEDEVSLLKELAADISLALDRLAKLDRINYLAQYDVLTGLPNRALFAERVAPLLEQARQRPGLSAGVQLDLQRLRDINDTFGRQVGDELLRLVAQRLHDFLGKKDPLGRTAGDHFVFVLSGMRDSKAVAHGVQRAMDSCFGAPFLLNGQELRVTAKAGIAVFPQDGDNVETLLKNADTALNKAKEQAGNFLFYAPEMNAQVAATLLLESRLRVALENGQFVMHYQPKFDTATGAITGVEGLIRWNDPEGRLVPPLEFIPLLEDSGLILDVGEWVLKEAIGDYRRWRQLVPKPPRIAVNVSSLQLRQDDFVDVVRRGVAGAGATDHGLDLEITESVLMTQVENNIEKLDKIRAMGVRVAIDDFGTGYSSLLYLAKLPLDSLKVDRSFIIRMSQEESDLTIVSAIVSLAHQLGLHVVAEGVDTTVQARLLEELNCDEIQGFLFSEPLTAEAIGQLIQRGESNRYGGGASASA